MKFTDVFLRNLKPQAKRYLVWENHGFGVRVSTTGKKNFIYSYRYDGKPRFLTLGTYPAMTLAEAYKAHAEAWKMLEQGHDPGAVAVAARREEREAPTVAELAAEYLERWAKPRKRSWKVDERILKKDVLPEWGRRKAKDITRREVIRLLDRVAARGGIMANRTLAVVRKMFNFAVSRDIIPASPCTAVQAPAPENRRDRVLTAEEIKTFWLNLDKTPISEEIKLALKLQLVTAQRKGEVISSAWADFDREGGWWTIPAEKSKNRLPHRVPLSALAKEILAAAQTLAGDSGWVFPSLRTTGHITPAAVDHALRQARPLLGLDHFVPHDLRRSAASHMTGMGIPRLVVSKILNHVERGVTAVYDRHSYDNEKRQALEAWGYRLQNIIQGAEKEGKIIPLFRGT